MSKRSTVFYALFVDIAILGTAIILSAVLLVQNVSLAAVTVDDRTDAYVNPVNPNTDLIFGNPEADIFIVEYGDLECPYCQTFHPHIKTLIESDWGVSGKVAWVWRNAFHINETSLEKAKALECVRANSGENSRTNGWKFIEESLSGGVLEDAYPFERYNLLFEKFGLSPKRIETCRKENEIARSIAISARDIELLEITETPFIQFISGNGELLFENAGVLTTSQLEGFVISIVQGSKN